MRRTTGISLGTLGTVGCLAASLALAGAPHAHDRQTPKAAVAQARPTVKLVNVAAPKPVVVPPAARPIVAAAAARPIAAAPAQADAFVVKRILTIDHPLRFGEYHWDDAGVPAGPITVTIDLAAETMSVWRGGYEIGATAVIYGLEGKETPLGTFPIMGKDAVHYSSLYNRAPMPWMLRLTGDGVSIHGSDMKAGYATHGCIGVPNGFAKRLFGATRIGDRVIITRGKMLDLGQKA